MTIPERTAAFVVVPDPLWVFPPRYHCVDCGYVTLDAEPMEAHQADQARHHTRWQRVRRWLSVRYVDDVLLPTNALELGAFLLSFGSAVVVGSLAGWLLDWWGMLISVPAGIAWGVMWPQLMMRLHERQRRRNRGPTKKQVR